MTIVIDITKRDAVNFSTAPLISFRRTDADRRPARPFVRPNDGPTPERDALDAKIRADMERQAARRRELAEEVRCAVRPLELVGAHNAEEGQKRRLILLAELARMGGEQVSVRDLTGSGFSVDTVRRYAIDMEKAGWVIRSMKGNGINQGKVILTITGMGRRKLAEGGQ